MPPHPDDERTIPAAPRGHRPNPASGSPGGKLEATLPATARRKRSDARTRRPTVGMKPATVALTQGGTLPAGSPAKTIERYQLGDELGRGGMGVVRVAHDASLRRDVALKLLLAQDNPRARQAFVEEAQITGQLEHPNIVPVHELGIDRDGRPWLTMKRVRGRTLRDLIVDAKRDAHRWADDAGEWIEIFAKVCDAIAYAHDRGVIHRDLKPENVMVGEFGEVLLMDWGLARPVDAAADPPPPKLAAATRTGTVATDRREQGEFLTVDGSVFGTPAFMAPEQATGHSEEIGPATDIFGLGAMLYSLLTLQPPYRATTVVDTLRLAAERTLDPPRRCAPERGIPVELDAIAMKAMAASPRHRYATAAELKDDLHAYLANRPIRARRDPLPARITKWVRRHPTTTIASTLAVVLISVAGTIGAVLLGQVEAHARTAAEARAKQVESDQQRREAQLRLLAEQERFSDLKAEFGLQVTQARDAVLTEFGERQDRYFAEGKLLEDFIASLGDTDLQRYIAAWERLLVAFDRGATTDVTDEDYAQLANLYNARGDWPRSIYICDRGLAVFAGSYRLLNNRGYARERLNDLEGAMADYSAAIAADPQAKNPWFQRATLRKRTGDPDGARDDFEQALAIAPSFHAARIELATLLSETGHPQQALAEYDRVLDASPDLPQALINRAITRDEQGDHAGAMQDFEHAIRVNPGNVAGHFHRGVVRSRAGDWPGACDDLERARELDDTFDPQLCYHLATAQMMLDRFPAALETIRVQLRRTPHAAVVHLRHGEILAASGRTEDAIHAFQRAIEAEPAMATPRLARGVSYLSQNNALAALTDFIAATALEPDRWECWGQRGRVELAIGRRQSGLDSLQRAWHLCPEPAQRDRIAALIRQGGGRVPD